MTYFCLELEFDNQRSWYYSLMPREHGTILLYIIHRLIIIYWCYCLVGNGYHETNWNHWELILTEIKPNWLSLKSRRNVKLSRNPLKKQFFTSVGWLDIPELFQRILTVAKVFEFSCMRFTRFLIVMCFILSQFPCHYLMFLYCRDQYIFWIDVFCFKLILFSKRIWQFNRQFAKFPESLRLDSNIPMKMYKLFTDITLFDYLFSILNKQVTFGDLIRLFLFLCYQYDIKYQWKFVV